MSDVGLKSIQSWSQVGPKTMMSRTYLYTE